MTDKVEFASAEWLAVAEEVLQKAVIGLDLGGKTFTVSEEFTDPPAHLLKDGDASIAWHFTVSDDGVDVAEGAVEDADMRTRVDYQAVLPVARLVYGTSEEAIAEAMRLREAAQATGERVGDETVLPPELLQRLFAVHNQLAERTL
jgi:hypothetical protein